MLNGVLQFLKNLFTFIAELFTTDDDEGSYLESELNPRGHKPNKKRQKPIQKYGRLVLAVVVLTYMLLALPLGGWVVWLHKKNEQQAKEVSSLKEKVATHGKELGQKRQEAKREAILSLVRSECQAALATYADVLAEIEIDPYWPSLGTDGRQEAEKSIQTHLKTIQRHLVETTKFNRWLNAKVPPELHKLHQPVLDGLNAFRDRCVPQLSQVSAKTDLTLLKEEVKRSLQELLNTLKKTMPDEEKIVADRTP